MEIINGEELAGMQFVKEEDGSLKVYEPKGKFIPKYGEEYWLINLMGDVSSCVYCDQECDRFTIKHNLIFRTEQECKDYKFYLNKLDEYKTEFTDEEWGNYDTMKYHIYYDYARKEVRLLNTFEYKCVTDYFTEDNAIKFIEEVGEDRIKKYMLDIWEG